MNQVSKQLPVGDMEHDLKLLDPIIIIDDS